MRTRKKIVETPRKPTPRANGRARRWRVADRQSWSQRWSAGLPTSPAPTTRARRPPRRPSRRKNYGGRYIHWGIREHAMAAAMNGMALHGGVMSPIPAPSSSSPTIPAPPSASARLMGQRVIHVMTHDSIGVGEDGPTHQPVEHVASLRMIPNLLRSSARPMASRRRKPGRLRSRPRPRARR